jgi:hypothetical protein
MIIYHYYPELESLMEKPVSRDPGEINILILGGSAISDTFCHTSTGLTEMLADSLRGKRKVLIHNMARVAQTSLDANIKMQLLEKSRFDYIVFYESINDTRANNCPVSDFDSLYRHIVFYQEVHTILSHPEMDKTILPFILDFCYHRLLYMFGIKHSIPKEFYQMDETCNCLKKIGDTTLLNYGNEVKTTATLRQNIEHIYTLCNKRASKLVLLTYTFYDKENYTLVGLLDKKAALKTPFIFPTEIWGKPNNVIKALERHNCVINQVHQAHKDILFSDLDSLMTKSDSTFLDICHLTKAGANTLFSTIGNSITHEELSTGK